MSKKFGKVVCLFLAAAMLVGSLDVNVSAEEQVFPIEQIEEGEAQYNEEVTQTLPTPTPEPTLTPEPTPEPTQTPFPTLGAREISFGSSSQSVPVGGSITLYPKIVPTTISNADLVWKSYDPSVATVENGVVTGISEGQTYITASLGSVSASCYIDVLPLPTPLVNIQGNSIVLCGQESYLTAVTEPYSEEISEWNVSNPLVAEIIGTGKKVSIKGLSEGTTVVSVRTISGKTARMTITVKNESNLYDEDSLLYDANDNVLFKKEDGIYVFARYKDYRENPDISLYKQIEGEKVTYVHSEVVLEKCSLDNLYVAAGTCGDNLEWIIENDGTFTITGEGEMTATPWDIYITSIKTVVIGEGITSIADYAFTNATHFSTLSSGSVSYKYRNQIEKVLLPNTLERIGTDAFSGQIGLSGELIIPDNVTEIGKDAFIGCRKLSRIVFNEKLKKIGESAFNGCSGLTGDLYIPNSVTEIGGSAFYGCTCLNGTVYIGGNVTSPYSDRGIDILRGCVNVTKIVNNSDCIVVLPELENDDWVTESNTALSILSIDKGQAIRKSSCTTTNEKSVSGKCGPTLYWNLDTEGLLTIQGNGEMTSNPWIDYRNSIRKVEICEGVTSICNNAFENCKNWKETLIIPDTVVSIGDYAFSNCTGLSGILNIPTSVASIGSGAFYSCTGLSGDLIIPSSVKKIGNAAFSNCTGFNGRILIQGKLEPFNEWNTSSLSLFGGCKNVKQITVNYSDVPIQLPKLDEDYWVSNMNPDITVTELSTGTVIRKSKSEGIISRAISGTCGDTMFWRLNTDGSLIIMGEGDMTSHPWTVYKDGIKKLELCEGITSICPEAFRNCSNIEGSLNIPSSVKEIGERAFHACTRLSGNLILPDNLRVVREGVFLGCSGLNGSIHLPENLCSIEREAFAACGIKGKIDIPEGTQRIESDAFIFLADNEIRITIPTSVVYCAADAFTYNSEGIEKIENNSECTIYLPQYDGKSNIAESIKWVNVDNPNLYINKISKGTAQKLCYVGIKSGEKIISEEYVAAGTKIKEPQIATEDGYYLNGWYASESVGTGASYINRMSEWDFDRSIHHSTMIFALVDKKMRDVSRNAESRISYPLNTVEVKTRDGWIRLTSAQRKVLTDEWLQYDSESYIENWCSTQNIVDYLVVSGDWDWDYYDQYWRQHSEGDELEIETDKTKMDSVSLNLNGIIGLNFYFTLSEEKSPREIFMNGPAGVKRINVNDLTFDEGLYKVTYNVSAKNMNDMVTVSVLDENGENIPWVQDDETKGAFEYSVMRYLDSAEANGGERLQNLAKAMKAYGIYAQNYFGNTTDQKIPSLQGINLSKYAKEESGHRLANARYVGSSLILKDTVAIRHYFNINDDIDKYTFTVDSNVVSPKEKDGMYYVEISNIPAADLAKAFACAVSDGTNEYAIKYSAMSYCQKAIAEPGDLGGLAHSMYWYCKYAGELFDVDTTPKYYSLECLDGMHTFSSAQYNFLKNFWYRDGQTGVDDWKAYALKHTYNECVQICQIEGGIDGPTEENLTVMGTPINCKDGTCYVTPAQLQKIHATWDFAGNAIEMAGHHSIVELEAVIGPTVHAVSGPTLECADGVHTFTQAQYNFLKGFWYREGQTSADDWKAYAHKHTYAECIQICQIEGGL